MKVYKFGGASVRSAEGIRNLNDIARACPGRLMVVVSALGKTTNALETLLNMYIDNSQVQEEQLTKIEQEHYAIATGLLTAAKAEAILAPLFVEIRSLMAGKLKGSYDFCYDQLVSYGEILSTSIVYGYLKQEGASINLLDARKLIVTDSNNREAGVNFDETAQRMSMELERSEQILLIQGFIGGNAEGYTTTLGREGSDYTAAVLASVTNAQSVTIWKDVPGILNADPKLFNNTVLLPSVSYQEAVELSYFGAQIIHPKTIKPLQNLSIPLFVKSFVNPAADGTVIDATATSGEVPVYVLKPNQVLITIRPKDLSFALEESLSEVFVILSRNRVKVSMIQNSAISISVVVEGVKRYIQPALAELKAKFIVLYNENLELFTIRNFRDEEAERITSGRRVYMLQKTRRTLRVLVDTGTYQAISL
ncbi:MAG TPA: aspartate kinase [Williamwhitmania sp.]|nr:aspartate kinase [Williamwhitmania sp.]